MLNFFHKRGTLQDIVVCYRSGLDQLYQISYLWYSAIGAATCVFVGLVVSMVTGCTDPDDVDPKLHMPFFDRLCCCLPNQSLDMMRCKLELLDPEAVAVRIYLFQLECVVINYLEIARILSASTQRFVKNIRPWNTKKLHSLWKKVFNTCTYNPLFYVYLSLYIQQETLLAREAIKTADDEPLDAYELDLEGGGHSVSRSAFDNNAYASDNKTAPPPYEGQNGGQQYAGLADDMRKLDEHNYEGMRVEYYDEDGGETKM